MFGLNWNCDLSSNKNYKLDINIIIVVNCIFIEIICEFGRDADAALFSRFCCGFSSTFFSFTWLYLACTWHVFFGTWPKLLCPGMFRQTHLAVLTGQIQKKSLRIPEQWCLALNTPTIPRLFHELTSLPMVHPP